MAGANSMFFYYLKKLEKAGLVCRKIRSNVVFYELTNQSQKLLASCEGLLWSTGVYRLHRCFFKFRIVREGSYGAGGFRRVEMVNWTALLGLEKGVRVRKTSRNWIVHVETLYGKHPGELFNLAKNLAERVRRSLMLKYGCLLDEGKIGRGYELAIDDHLSRDAAVEYLLMPERVKKLEGKVDALHYDLEELTSLLKRALQPPVPNNLRKDVDYVA